MKPIYRTTGSCAASVKKLEDFVAEGKLRNEACQLVQIDYCADCHMGCTMQETCGQFKQEVDITLKEWEEEQE